MTKVKIENMDKLTRELDLYLDSNVSEFYTKEYKKVLEYYCNRFPEDKMNSFEKCYAFFKDKVFEYASDNSNIEVLEEENSFIINLEDSIMTFRIEFFKDTETIVFWYNHAYCVCEFGCSAYESAIAILKYFISLLSEVKKIYSETKKLFEIDRKDSEIAKQSIKNLCKKKWSKNSRYLIQSSGLVSELFVQLSNGKLYHFTIIHKAFLENPSEIEDLFEKPREMIAEGWCCSCLGFYYSVENFDEYKEKADVIEECMGWKWGRAIAIE